jgi:hypothetical protein
VDWWSVASKKKRIYRCKKEEREREPGENKIQIKILDINYAKKWRGEKEKKNKENTVTTLSCVYFYKGEKRRRRRGLLFVHSGDGSL